MSLHTLPARATASHRGRAKVAGLFAAVSVVLTYPAVTVQPAAAATPAQYTDHTYSSSAGAASADKPQSKLWYNDGAWWALMATPGGTINIYKLLSDHTWKDTGTVVDTRASSTGDALWTGGKLYVVSRTAGTSGAVKAYRFSYSGGSYTLDSGQTKTFSGGGTESATVDKDSTGRLWVTFTRGSVVYVTHTTDSTVTSWTTPFRITGADTTVSADDISAVVSFEGKIGVMWSDQESNAMRFAYHTDGAADTSWTVETPLAGTGLADDHINLKTLMGDDSGRLYAAVKTSNTVSTDPILLVLTRTAGGTWHHATTATVADKLTRPQLALDKTNRVMYVLQSTEGGGSIYYKTSPLGDNPSFSSGKGATFLAKSGYKINNVSTMKDPVTATTGLVAIATDEYQHRYFHSELSLGGTTTPPPTTTRTVTVNAEADTMVKQASSTTNYGTTTPLKSDQQDVTGTSSAINSYVRFQVPALATGETIASAKLSLNLSNGTTNGPAIYKTDATWSETGMTWSSGRPTRSSSTAVGNYGSVGTGRVSTSVSGVSAAGTVSFELAPEATDGLDFSSREAGSTAAPQLILSITSP